MNNVAKPFPGAGMNLTANIAALMDAPVIGGPVAMSGAVAVTPESLLYYCASRLDSIDKKIDAHFKDQQAKNTASEEIGKLQSILGRASFQAKGDSADFNADVHAAEGNEILAIYRNTQNAEVKKAAGEAFKLRTGIDPEAAAPSGISVVDVNNAKAAIAEQTPAQWAQRIDNVKSVATSLSKGAELNMIQLQSYVSQRQLAIQLTTQIMQAVNEGCKQVAGNIRG
jgi:hypothetical protein